MMTGPKKSVGVLLPLELYRRIEAQAAESGRSIPGYIRQVLKCYLWHVENAPETLTDHWEV